MAKKSSFKNIFKSQKKKEANDWAARKKTFLEGLEKLSKETGVQIAINANFVFAPYNPAPQVKDWAECKKENEKVLKQADIDRKKMSEKEFKQIYPDLPYDNDQFYAKNQGKDSKA